MWISRQIIAAQTGKPAADLAEITGSGKAQGVNDYRSLPFAGPWGIAYLPPDAAQAVVVSTRAGDVSVGALAESRGIQPGELMLFSSGGAQIYLKNNGEIEINGQVFKAKGAT
ncbi:MAG: hypothetical protein LKJ45_06255 [Oscillospiraceae bacterium]|jgi:phage gp45-like|nr:hypothetical protein [Oscillospiraceae bacterium]